MRWLRIAVFVSGGLTWMAVALPVSPAQKSASTASFEKSIQPFLSKNCYVCHNAQLQSGGLNLESYKTAASDQLNLLERVANKLRTGEMPPKGMPQPGATELKGVIQWIDEALERAESSARPDPGRVTARRLNRAEYNNTVRDLLGVDIEPASDFPQDDSAYGFDNIADALSLSPSLMEKYMAAAEKISRLAVFGPELRPSSVRIEPTRPRRMEANPVRIQQPPFYSMTDYDATGISHPGSYHLAHRFPATGEYLFRVRADGARPPGSEPQQLDLWLDGTIVKSFEVPNLVTATNERLPVFMEVRLKVAAGRHLLIAAFPRLFEGLPVTFNGPNPSKKPVPPPPDPARFLPPLPADATPAQVEARKAQIERIKSRKPLFEGMAIAEFEVIGPHHYSKGPSSESLRKLYACGHLKGGHLKGCARTIVAGLARRAFRRPVASNELTDLLGVVSNAEERGRSFEQAIALAVQTVLVSPDFLFRIERDRNQTSAGTSHQISQHELASRLSYFLWSSMPDDELLHCADRKRLRNPQVLTAQVRRMLKDPKAKALVENFAGQWLEVRRLESVQPDRDKFPDFDDYLRSSMLKETELFLQNLLRADGSILDLVDGKYTFLNERLARHYGIRGVTGAEFRRVDLTGTGRSGILTQASVLTVSSYGNRTSPVLRGKWVLENLLNTPPPPPPANVPSLNEAEVGSTASLRQQMEQHRQNPACASCHTRMDPLGFALENYDAVGEWRVKDGSFPIDATGSLPDGRVIDGAEGLIATIRTQKDAFTEALTEKLLTYALGRGVERGDRRAVKRIATTVAAKEYRFSVLALEIVRSLPFQMRRGDRE